MPTCGLPSLRGGSVLGGALSLSVTTMGAGILTLPSAYADAGVVPAMVVLIGVTMLTVVSIDFIIIGVEKLGLNSYEELTRELLGRHAEAFIRSVLLLLNIGASISYLVVVEDLLSPLQPHVTRHLPLLASSKHTLLAVWALLILPLSCVPTLGSLHVSSFFAISATSFICLLVIYRYFIPGPTDLTPITKAAVANGTALPAWWWGVHPLLALPIIMFSFGCQPLAFQIYAGLEDMRRSTMLKVSIVSLIITGVIHAAVGLFGYLSNPVDVRDNIISNYDPNVDGLFRVGYLVYAAPIIMAYVLMLFPIRDSIFIMWYGFSSASVATHVPSSKDFKQLMREEEKLELLVQAEAAQRRAAHTVAAAGYGSVEAELHDVVEAKKHHNNVERIPLRDHLIVSIALSSAGVTIALLAPGMVSVVALLGGVCASTLCFIAPGLFRWQLHYRNIAPCSSALEWCLMVFMIGFGVVGGVVGTTVAFTASIFGP